MSTAFLSLTAHDTPPTKIHPTEYDITIVSTQWARNGFVIIEYAIHDDQGHYAEGDTNLVCIPRKDYESSLASFTDYVANHSHYRNNPDHIIPWLTGCHFLYQHDYITAANKEII